jgi:hypothetical protein
MCRHRACRARHTAAGWRHREHCSHARPQVVIHTVTTGGMPGWQITLIAIGAALLAAFVSVFLDRILAARRQQPTTAA